MTSGNVGPCVYPGCKGDGGNPTLTRDVICPSSRGHYKRVLDRLREHWLVLHTLLPAPARQPGERVVVRSGEKTYGHEREWASDSAALIAHHFNDAHTALRDHLRHPPILIGTGEEVRIKMAHHYLTSWFDELCTYPHAEPAASAFYDLDRSIRSGLGETKRRQRVKVPCPECRLLTLVRVEDIDGDGGVECRSPGCGHRANADAQEQWTVFLAGNVLTYGDADPAKAG